MKKILFIAALLLLSTEITIAQSDAQKFERTLALKQVNGAVVQSTQVEITNQQITAQQLESLRNEISGKDEIALIQTSDMKTLVFIHTNGVNVDVIKELLLLVTENDFIIKEPHDLTDDEIIALMQSL
jgi:hypothetical protein